MIEINEQNFETEVLKTDLPVVVDFWADWCGPCRMLTPVVEAVAQIMNGKIKFVKLDVDNNATIAGRFAIRTIPSLLIFKQGRVVDQLIGATTQAKLIEVLERILR